MHVSYGNNSPDQQTIAGESSHTSQTVQLNKNVWNNIATLKCHFVNDKIQVVNNSNSKAIPTGCHILSLLIPFVATTIYQISGKNIWSGLEFFLN